MIAHDAVAAQDIAVLQGIQDAAGVRLLDSCGAPNHAGEAALKALNPVIGRPLTMDLGNARLTTELPLDLVSAWEWQWGDSALMPRVAPSGSDLNWEQTPGGMAALWTAPNGSVVRVGVMSRRHDYVAVGYDAAGMLIEPPGMVYSNTPGEAWEGWLEVYAQPELLV